MGNICGFEWVFDGLPRRCVEFAGHIGAHRTAPFDMVAAVDDVRAIASRLAAAEARAEKVEGEVRYLRAVVAWRKGLAESETCESCKCSDCQAWLAANPEPQPPEGVAP